MCEERALYNSIKIGDNDTLWIEAIGEIVAYVKKINENINITLNTLFERNNIPHDRFDFINIDIQGAELKALKGAVHILPHIKAIYAEVNEKMLYEGAGLLPELDEYLATFNFKRVITNMTRHGWGDALYIKNYVSPDIHMNDIDTMNYMNRNDII